MQNFMEIILKVPRSQMNLQIFRYDRFSDPNVFKMSVILNMSTSSPLHPNYSSELKDSTAQYSSELKRLYESLTLETPSPLRKLDAGGKPSTWSPPGRLVEHFP